jgi:H+-translocating NAD(P) transhydrogenase subunit alpha
MKPIMKSIMLNLQTSAPTPGRFLGTLPLWLVLVSWIVVAAPAPRVLAQADAASATAGPSARVGAGEEASLDAAGEVATTDATDPEAATATSGWNSEQRTTRAAILISSFTVFLLAVFVGFEIITKVPPTLHTPLMSGSNAISGITIVGAILTAGHVLGGFGAFLGMLAVILAMVNVVGGFLVTHRMLMMFKKR